VVPQSGALSTSQSIYSFSFIYSDDLCSPAQTIKQSQACWMMVMLCEIVRSRDSDEMTLAVGHREVVPTMSFMTLVLYTCNSKTSRITRDMSHTVYVVYVQVFYIAFVYRNVPRTLNHGHSPPPDNRPRTEASPNRQNCTRYSIIVNLTL